MATQEIRDRIEELKRWSFLLWMKDNWTSADWDEDRKINNELRKLEGELAKMEA